jgi:hypothetical protein
MNRNVTKENFTISKIPSSNQQPPKSPLLTNNSIFGIQIYEGLQNVNHIRNPNIHESPMINTIIDPKP